MIKGIFSLPLRALQGFIDSIFELLEVPLTSPDYTCISKRSKTVQVKYRNKVIRHIAIDSTGLKVFGEGDWKVKKHGAENAKLGANST
ncbi:transposase [Vibrio crassostreae]|nr:DDE family transposase [Vibrio crassostreae]CAK2532806.1 transposase [Vibrio crassostreae]CAK3889621.1 transposase [Vibrio crassostreae]